MIKYKDITMPEELYFYMKNFNYGYLTKENKIIYEKNPTCNNYWYDKYILQDTNDLINTKTGNCFDQTEFARTWFENNNYKVKSFHDQIDNHPTFSHSFIIFKDIRCENIYSWFETTWNKYRGIHSFSNSYDAIKYNYDIYAKEIENNKLNIDNISIIEFTTPKKHSTIKEYNENIKAGKILTLNRNR